MSPRKKDGASAQQGKETARQDKRAARQGTKVRGGSAGRRGPWGVIVALLFGLVLGAAGMFAVQHMDVLNALGTSDEPSVDITSSKYLAGRTSVSADELDAVLGTYEVDGVVTPVTVREAIEESTSVEAVRNADGSYEVPNADVVLAIARNRILEAEAERRGIEATDEDVAAYAKDTLGTDDFGVIASGYDMSADQAKGLMKRSAVLRLLRDEVTSVQVPSEPKAPAKPDDGQQDVPSAKYATYVLDLVGDEWDASANSWASEDGPYREALRDYTISNEAATYSAAQAAYDETLVLIAKAEQQRSNEWTAYVNDLLCNVSIELGTLVV